MCANREVISRRVIHGISTDFGAFSIPFLPLGQNRLYDVGMRAHRVACLTVELPTPFGMDCRWTMFVSLEAGESLGWGNRAAGKSMLALALMGCCTWWRVHGEHGSRA